MQVPYKQGFGIWGVFYGFVVLVEGIVCRYINSQILRLFIILVESGKMLKRILLIAALMTIALSFAGCQTVQGIGRDISWTGRAGAEAIDNIIYPPHKNQEPEIAYQGY